MPQRLGTVFLYSCSIPSHKPLAYLEPIGRQLQGQEFRLRLPPALPGTKPEAREGSLQITTSLSRPLSFAGALAAP